MYLYIYVIIYISGCLFLPILWVPHMKPQDFLFWSNIFLGSWLLFLIKEPAFLSTKCPTDSPFDWHDMHDFWWCFPRKDVQRSCRPRAARFSLAFCNSFTQVLKNTWKRNPPLLLLNRAGWTETVGFVGSEMIWMRSIFFLVCHFEKRTSFGAKKHLLVYEKGYHIFKMIPTCCNGGPPGERRCLSWRAWLPW